MVESFVVRESNAPAPSSSVTFETSVNPFNGLFLAPFSGCRKGSWGVGVGFTQDQMTSMVLGPEVNLNCD